jgi:hypothetical protein
MKVHPRPEHMRIDDKHLFACWTCYFDCLTHGLPLPILDLDFRLWIVGRLAIRVFLLTLCPIGGSVHWNMLQHFTGNVVFQLDPRHRFVGAFRHRREGSVRWPGRIDNHAGSLDLVAQ